MTTDIDGRRTVLLRIPDPIDDSGSLFVALKYLLRLPLTLFRLAQVLRMLNVRVVNVHYPTLGALNVLILRRLGFFRGRLVLSFHGLDLRNASQLRGRSRELWQTLLSGADALVCCSRTLAQELQAFASTPVTAKIHVVSNGVDTEALAAEVPADFVLPSRLCGKRYILNVATFEHKKAQDVLIDAFARIAGKERDVLLVMIGRDGPTRSAIEDAIRARGLNDRIVLLTDLPHAEVLGYLRHATIFTLPSRAEGLPLALLEAGAFEKAVVASRVDGIPEVVSSDTLGCLVDADDRDGLADALLCLLHDDQRRASLGSALRKHVAQRFTWRSAYEQYIKTFG